MEYYAKNKIKVLKDFGITLSSEQKARIYNAKTEFEIDRIARDILQPYQY